MMLAAILFAVIGSFTLGLFCGMSKGGALK